MAQKLEVIHNYLIITDTVNSSTVEFPTNRVRYKDSGDTFSIISVDDNSQNKSYQISELVDSEGAAFADKEAILLFLRESTGFNTASGGSDVTDNSNGFVDYNDAATSVTPITLVADTWTDVPNDTLGTYTNTAYMPEGMTTLMDGTTGYLDFSELTLGSDIHIRIDYTVTPNTNNALVESRYELGNGGGTYTLPINSKRLDSGSGVPYPSDKASFYIYMGDENTLQGVGKLQVKLTTGGTLINNGVAIKIYKK